MDLQGKLKKIKLVVMDCDGVLTDGRLYFGASGEELKVFHVRDGQGIVAWHAAGGVSGIISGRSSPIVASRAEQLGITFIYQGVVHKVKALEDLMRDALVVSEEVAFIGDDSPDLEVFPFVGLSVAVADAHHETRMAADYVTLSNGGQGAVRELLDMLIKAKTQ